MKKFCKWEIGNCRGRLKMGEMLLYYNYWSCSKDI